MAQAHHESHRTRIALFKVIYLLAVTAVIFAVPSFVVTRPAQWYVVTALLLVQAFTLLANRIAAIEVMPRTGYAKADANRPAGFSCSVTVPSAAPVGPATGP